MKKQKKADLVPLYITAAVLLFSVSLHVISRNLASRVDETDDGRRRETTLVEQIEAITYDWRVRRGAALNGPTNIAGGMATVLFDDFAVEKVNDGSWSLDYAPATNQDAARKLFPLPWPWPRFIHGQVVRELAAQGAVAIGYDIMFSEGMRDLQEDRVFVEGIGLLSSDEFFAHEIGHAGNVYLGIESGIVPLESFRTNAAALASIDSHTDHNVLRRAKPFSTVRLWHPLILEMAKPLSLQLAFASVEKDKVVIPIAGSEENTAPFVVPLNPNGTIKLTSDGQIDVGDDPADEGPQTEKPFEEQRIWNLGIALAAKAMGIDLDQAEVRKRSVILRGPNNLVRTIPLDPAGYFFIDWSIRFEDVKDERTPIYFGSLGEILNSDWNRRNGGDDIHNNFTNSIVLVGSVATGNNVSDIGATPLDSRTPLVTKHLNIANSIITGRFVERTSLSTEVLVILVLGLISALLTWRLRVLVAAIGVGGLCLSYVIFTIGMYLEYRYWIPIVMPMFGGLLLPHFSLVTYRVMFEQKEQRRVRGIFQRIVSPDVVQELLSAERLSLGGARVQITVFFADVRGFTEFTDSTQQTAEDFVVKNKLSEDQSRAYFDRIAAEQLSTVNMYLATIADTIKTHRGTLDKYMGDCVMAFWGAPTPNERHALSCVSAAIDAQRALYALNQERYAENERRKLENATLLAEGKPPIPLLPLLSLGSGINTGYATVGLMGSDATILNYTVFGREVNLASRLEGASGRGRILISEATYQELLRDSPELAATCIAQAPITPKGFRQPIRIYEVPWKAQEKPATPAEAVPASETPPREQPVTTGKQ